MSKLMNIHFAGAELMTGLPEYRNGGLFIDTGVLILKKDDETRGLERFREEGERSGKGAVEVVPMFTPDDDVVVEWRAVTVGFLDLLLEDVNEKLGLHGTDKLSLPQMLEAGSWKVCLLPLSPYPLLSLIVRKGESLTNISFSTGRTRNGRDLKTEHAVSTNRYSF
jgi:hypothetical protein